jgi:hypothetical protein
MLCGAGAAMLLGGRSALRQEVGNWAAVPSDKFRVALANVAADLGILKFQVVLKLVGAHDAHDGNAVLLQDEILAIQVIRTRLSDSAKIDTGFGYGYAIDRGWFDFINVHRP